jgi:hypothetical protein
LRCGARRRAARGRRRAAPLTPEPTALRILR